ncbi:hypothetical protein LSAT2_011694 [Lamellibrachia satsuma]|nr:hypothetical protein LSAT2_011694 [Lamellibrachia satsuma]
MKRVGESLTRRESNLIASRCYHVTRRESGYDVIASGLNYESAQATVPDWIRSPDVKCDTCLPATGGPAAPSSSRTGGGGRDFWAAYNTSITSSFNITRCPQPLKKFIASTFCSFHLVVDTYVSDKQLKYDIPLRTVNHATIFGTLEAAIDTYAIAENLIVQSTLEKNSSTSPRKMFPVTNFRMTASRKIAGQVEESGFLCYESSFVLVTYLGEAIGA